MHYPMLKYNIIIFKQLTTSKVARKNVLNNDHAVSNIESYSQLGGINFKGETVFTKSLVAEILDIDERTIDRYLNSSNQELKENGYRVLTNNDLRPLRSDDVDDTNVVNINSKAPSLGIFSFRAVLNLAMLVKESEKAKHLLREILISIINDDEFSEELKLKIVEQTSRQGHIANYFNLNLTNFNIKKSVFFRVFA